MSKNSEAGGRWDASETAFGSARLLESFAVRCAERSVNLRRYYVYPSLMNAEAIHWDNLSKDLRAESEKLSNESRSETGSAEKDRAGEGASAPDEIKMERDALQSIVASAQKREAEAERTLQLLLIAGHVQEDRVEQARALARL